MPKKSKKSNIGASPAPALAEKPPAVELVAVQKLSKDLVDSAALLSQREARFIADTYIQLQKVRVAGGNRAHSLEKLEEPNALQSYITDQMKIFEKQMERPMKKFAMNSPAGKWLLSVCGIGPILAAGLIAYVDADKCQTGTHLFKYAGLVPGQKRKSGQKIDWNPHLKRLCWLLGESFVKVHNNPNDFYGKIYMKRKEYETVKNEKLEYKDQAEAELKEKKYDKKTEAYKHLSVGKLPPAAINARSKRYAVKLLLSHLSQVLWEETHDEPWAKPYAIAHLGHVDYIPVPYR